MYVCPSEIVRILAFTSKIKPWKESKIKKKNTSFRHQYIFFIYFSKNWPLTSKTSFPKKCVLQVMCYCSIILYINPGQISQVGYEPHYILLR